MMTTETRPKPTYLAPALDKGLDVLEALAATGGPLTQAQIARVLERHPISGAYRLTLRLFALGHSQPPHDALIRAADPVMRQLTAETGFACHLGILDGDQIMVLHQIESLARVRVSIAVGSTIAATQSAGGRILLAARDSDGKQKLAPAYEAARSESVEGLSDLAMAIGGLGSLRAALTVTALVRDHDQFVAAVSGPLKEATTAITQRAGLHTGQEEGDEGVNHVR